MNNLEENQRIDDLQCKGYKIIQDKSLFCFGVDAVLLADFAKIKKKARVMDFCTGSGVILLLMEAKEKGNEFVGMEILEESAKLAVKSIEMNGLSDKIKIINKDIKEVPEIFPAASFDVVTCNPPYISESHGLLNKDLPLNIARHEICITLEEIVYNAGYLLKPGGKINIIHKPFRIAEIFEYMKKYKIEPKRMRLIQSYINKEPSMVLIEGVKGGNPRLKVESNLIIYKDTNVYTDEINNIYDIQN